MPIPSFPNCGSCSDSQLPVQTVPVPYCGQEESNDACTSNKGKFYDRITEDFVVPKVGRQGKMFVCEGNLWAKYQWVAIANGADKVSVYPIIEVGNKTITILNGCRSGEQIFGNAEDGKDFPTGTVIYPVPPQGCDSNFCERVSNAIRTCGVEAVLELLKTTEEICFTNVPELEEVERGHLFVGTMPDPCNCPEDYGYGEGVGVAQDPDNLWRSCIRKLTKIFSNLGGTTLCFSSLPSYNKLTDTAKLARSLVLTEKGCIAKGESLYACEESNDVSSDGADAIVVCSSGEKKIIVPTCNSMIIGCCDEDGENPKWVVKPRGYNLYLLDTPIEVHEEAIPLQGENAGTAVTLPASINITKSFELSLIPDRCYDGKIYALVDFFWKTSNASASLAIDIFYNDEYYRKLMTVDSSTSDISAWTFQDYVPLDLATPNQFKFRATKVQGSGTYRSLVRILGFYA